MPLCNPKGDLTGQYLHFHCHSVVLRVSSSWFRSVLQANVKEVIIPKSFIYHKICEQEEFGNLDPHADTIQEFFDIVHRVSNYTSIDFRVDYSDLELALMAHYIDSQWLLKEIQIGITRFIKEIDCINAIYDDVKYLEYLLTLYVWSVHFFHWTILEIQLLNIFRNLKISAWRTPTDKKFRPIMNLFPVDELINIMHKLSCDDRLNGVP